MNLRAMVAITRKDLIVVRQSPAVLVPLIVVPLLLLLILPAVGGVVLARTDPESGGIQDFRDETAAFFDNLPEAISENLASYDNEVQRVAYIVFNMFFPSLYLLLPVMVANVIAADSFVGEKERKTLEALFYAPISDRELYLAKIMGPWLAGIAIGWLGYIAFAVVVTVTTISFMGEALVLNLTWLLMIVWVVPAVSGLGLGAMVLVSSRVNTFQEAYQLGAVVVLPILLLLFGQIGGLVYFSAQVVLLVGLIVWLFTIGLVWYGAQTFRRSELIVRT